MVAQDVWQYINDRCNPYAELQMDGLVVVDGTGKTIDESISVVAGRSDPQVREYLDGSITGSFQFGVYAMAKNRVKVNQWLQDVVDHFKTNPNIELSNEIIFTAKPTVSPYLLERTDNGGFIYAAYFDVTYDETPM